jgi:hypothetical protein
VGYVTSRPDKNRIGPRRRQQQLRSCQEKTVHQSAVQPHGMLRHEIKLRRSNLIPRKEDNERAIQKGKQRTEMNTKRYKESARQSLKNG